MNRDLNRERRLQQALFRLDTDYPRCLLCGEDDCRCLEQHHIAQNRYGEDLVILCRNCHRKERDSQRDDPPPVSDGEPPLLERIGHFLLGLATLFELGVERLREYGESLIEAARVCPPPYGLAGGSAS